MRLSILGALVALGVAAAQAAAGGTGTSRLIVFSAVPKGAGAAQLFRVTTTGKGLRQITTGRLSATAPTFSPNGKEVAFTRLGSGIFAVSPGGTGLHRLTSGSRDSQPVWSPDGKHIAFLRPHKAGWGVYVMSSSGRGVRWLSKAPPAGRPSWTTDGKAILIPAGGDLVQINTRSGKPEKYFGLTLDIQTAGTATVSPDNGLIAYIGPRLSTGAPDCGEARCPQYGLYLANVSGRHRAHKIVNDTGPAGWSPDGTTLVFVAKGKLTLWAVGLGRKTTIATHPNVPAGDSPPAWQPR